MEIFWSVLGLLFIFTSFVFLFFYSSKMDSRSKRAYQQLQDMKGLIEQNRTYLSPVARDPVGNMLYVTSSDSGLYLYINNKLAVVYYCDDVHGSAGNIGICGDVSEVPGWAACLEKAIEANKAREERARRQREMAMRQWNNTAKKRQAEIEADKKANPWKYEDCSRCKYYEWSVYSDGDSDCRCVKRRYSSSGNRLLDHACEDFKRR